MTKQIKFFLSLFILTLLSGCYTYSESILDYTISTKEMVNPTKEGRSCNDSSEEPFIERLFFGDIDLTVEKARLNGGITNITSIEKEVGRGFISQRICIVVKGT